MKRSISIAIFLSSVATGGCKFPKGHQTPDPRSLFKESYTGYDLSGLAKTCYKVEGAESCLQDGSPQDEFAKACVEKGYAVYTCDCNFYLCSNDIADKSASTGKYADVTVSGASLTGYDRSGSKRVCKPMPAGVFCTQSFGPADQFAIDCGKAGFTSLQCGCHDYICSQKIP